MYARIDIPEHYIGAARTRMEELNGAIDKANKAHEEAKKAPPGTISRAQLNADRALQKDMLNIESRIPEELYLQRATLGKELTKLRDELRQRLSAAGQSPLPAGERSTPLSEMIAALPDEAAQRLVNALGNFCSHNDPKMLRADLSSVFSLDDTSRVAEDWEDYMNSHSISFLGGGNSLNFLVTKTTPPSEPEVLKLESRFGRPRLMDSVAHAALPDAFTSTAATRMLLLPPNEMGSPRAGTLMVTTLCQEGAANEYAEKCYREANKLGSFTEFAQQCTEVTMQMCTTFMNFEVNNIYFPDAKISNWVIDRDPAGRGPILKISDTKSLIRSPPDRYELNHWQNEGIPRGFIGSAGFLSNEILSKTTSPAEAHAGILGRNMYFFITGKCPPDTGQLACTEDIFKKPEMKEFGDLIRNLTRDSPRMSLANVRKWLQEMRIEEIKLDPGYKIIQTTIANAGTLSGGNNFFANLEASLREVCTSIPYDKNTALKTLDTLAIKVFAATQQVYEQRNILTATINRQDLFPRDSLNANLKTHIDRSGTDLNALVGGLNAHAKQVQGEEHKQRLNEIQRYKTAIGQIRSSQANPNQETTPTGTITPRK